jgi:hypothetical protein
MHQNHDKRKTGSSVLLLSFSKDAEGFAFQLAYKMACLQTTLSFGRGCNR